MKKYKTKSFYYSNRPVFGIPAIFYILVGGRGCGKTYTSQNFLLRRFFKHGEKCLWLRLKEPSVKMLLANDAKDFIDSKLIEKWKITGIKVKNNTVYLTREDPEDDSTYREFCRIMALSTFYIAKGVALNKTGKAKTKEKIRDESIAKGLITKTVKKFKNIVLDEMNQEKSEKKTFDITYAFVNQLETICRLDKDRRIILSGNTLDEASDILSQAFNFIPNELGIYRLHNKHAVIHYIEDSDKYKKARAESIAGILAPDESTFTNIVASDIDLLSKRKPGLPSYVIRFENGRQFVVCGDIITKQKLPPSSKLHIIAMKPYLKGIPYYKESAEKIIAMAQQRVFKFDMMLTLKQFYQQIKLLKS